METLWKNSRSLAENLCGEDIELRGLVDGLNRILPEKLIAPRDQIVQVLHHDRLLIGGGGRSGADRTGPYAILRSGLRFPSSPPAALGRCPYSPEAPSTHRWAA